MATSTFSGARCRFKINGNIIAFAAGVSGSESVEYDPVDVLDLLSVKEFVPVAYRATISAQVFRVVGASLKALGIFPTENNILTSGDMVAALEDKLTGETVQQFQGVKCSEHSFDVTARGIVSENISFVAIRTIDESEIPANGG